MDLNSSTHSGTAVSLISASAQLITILLPLVFALGFAYANGYFYSIDCYWSVSLLNFQEIISFSVASIIPITLGAIISFQIKLQGSNNNKILKTSFYIYLASLVAGALKCAFDNDSYISAFITHTCALLLVLFGTYSAQAYFHVINNDTFKIKLSAIIVLGGIAMIAGASAGTGYAKGHSQIVNIENKFAKLSGDYVFGRQQEEYLVTKVDGKYLTFKKTDNELTFFLKDSLSKYSINSATNNW